MSSRSKRPHKPTSKFLNYYTKEICSSPNGVQKVKTTPQLNKNTSRVNLNKGKYNAETVHKIKEEREESNEDMGSPSTPETRLSATEIRRSNRQHKPNQKLKEFLKNNYDDPGKSNALDTPLTKKSTGSIHSTKRVGVKSVAAISPMIRKEQSKSPSSCSKHISVGLVDCFEGLTNDLSRSHPSKRIASKELFQKKAIVGRSSEPKSGGEGQRSDALERGSLRNKGAKRLLERDESDVKREPLRKVQIIDPNMLRNLTKTKKSTKITTVVETVSIDRNPRRKTFTRNRKLKVTKQAPLNRPPSPTSSSPPTSSEEEGTYKSPPATHPRSSFTHQQKLKKLKAYQLREKKASTPPQEKDVKETLKKFLIMGTKIANAISETLKHNEEALLSKSSAFERKCLSLVHALAKQGSDLEEDDMKKVLKLLDEEQEERRIYRHTFLESLRVSHLTNMALYSQMLRLLKTL